MSSHIVSLTPGLAIAIREKLFTLIGYQMAQVEIEVTEGMKHTEVLIKELQKAIDRAKLR